MNEDQYRRRLALWLRSFPMIGVFVLLTLALLLSDHRASIVSQKLDGSDPTLQQKISLDLESQAGKSVLAESL